MKTAVYTDSTYWDIRLSWASSMFFIVSAANATIKNILYLPSSVGSMLSMVAGVVIWGSYLSCWGIVRKRKPKLLLNSVVVFVIIYSLSAVLITFQGDPMDLMLKGTAFLTFAWWIPTGVLVSAVEDKSVLYNVWVRSSYIISCFCFLLFLYHRSPEDYTGAADYNMFFGYTLVLPLLIQANELFRTKKKWLFLLVIIEIFALIMFASRGVLLSVVFFFIYKFAFETDSIVRKTIATLILILLVYILTQSIQTLAERLVQVLSYFDLQSRTIDALATGMIDDTSGRDNIWKVCFKMIEERPLLGWGLGGEYYNISQKIMGSVEGLTAEAWHPHNGIIQNFVCFGILGGFFATAFCLYPLFHLKRTKDRCTHDLLVIFASAAVIPICVSSANFFTTPAVAVYLYLFYYSSRNRKVASCA